MTRILQLIHDVCAKNIHVTKRDLFYTDVKLFKSQDESYGVLDDVACLLGCTRTSLNGIFLISAYMEKISNLDIIDCV